MKKFCIILFALLMLSSVANAATFEDTENLDCEYAIERLHYLGIVNGTGENKFSPEKTVTRAELSKMVADISNITTGVNDNKFSDIDNHWAKGYILKVANNGKINGYPDGTFKPDNDVSYSEAIAIILRCMGYSDLESNTSDKWYDGYIAKMKEINLDDGLGDFSSEEPANRGDIAILVWNMIASTKRVNNTKTILEEQFGKYTFWKDVKVTDISTYNRDIVYDTSKGKLIIKEDIDFSDLGGNISGFYDSESQSIIGKKADEGQNVVKLSGSLVDLKNYSPFSSNNVYGYGDKNYAEYVEIFLKKGTNNIVRVVYYDTRESHFAENIKITASKVSIESRDVYDESIVLLDNGEMITYKNLRTESVKDINKNALLVANGKVVEWTSVPENSVIREIKKDLIYTFFSKYIDGNIEKSEVNLKTLTIDGKEYTVASDAICQNSKTKDTMKLKEGLTRNDITKIAKEDSKVRIYLNEFNEIVKLEFEYDIWEVNKQAERKDEYKEIEKEINRIGFVTDMDYTSDDEENDEMNIQVLSLPSVKKKSYIVDNDNFEIGDFIYNKSGDGLVEITSNTKFELFNFDYASNDTKDYTFDSSSQIIEVVLQISDKNKEKYSKVSMRQIKYDDLADYSKYKNVFIISNEKDEVIRLYAVKEIGLSYDMGIVKKTEEIISGDVLDRVEVSIADNNKKVKKYDTYPVMGYGVGDIVTYEVKDDMLTISEVYKHELIGDSKDLVVNDSNKGILSFKDSDVTIDTNSSSFEIDGEEYDFEDLIVILASVSKDKDSDEWIFSSWKTADINKLKIKSGCRIALNEITGTFIIYEGYVAD